MKNGKHLVVSLLIAFALAGCAGKEAVKPSTAGGEQQAAPADANTWFLIYRVICIAYHSLLPGPITPMRRWW